MAKKDNTKETPLMQQYNAIKGKYPDALLLFRVGDFYETFGKDAIKCARILDIVLTKRNNGSENNELAGFPHHSLDTYLPKLVRAGLRVAICDQLEDPKATKSIVKRGVTELVTPGVSLNDEVLSSKSNNFLLAVHANKDNFGLALLDISTGEFLIGEGNLSELKKTIQSFNPSEIIYQKYQKLPLENTQAKFALDDWAFQSTYATDKILNHFKIKSIKGFGIEDLKDGIVAAGAIFAYLEDTHHHKIQHITHIQRLQNDLYVWMDPFTIKNLELIFPSNHNGTSLLDILDQTLSPMGARLLKRWLIMILKDSKTIKERQALVQYFLKNQEVRESIEEQLEEISDLERMTVKVSTGRISPKQLFQMANSIQNALSIAEILQENRVDLPHINFENLSELQQIFDRILFTLSDDPPHIASKGNVIASGFSDELDQLRKIQFNGKDYLEQMREREVERTGINSIKIAYNNVFGYYIEVRNTHKDKVPEDWTRKQTLVNAERYITEELKTYESQILGAEEKILAIETTIFNDLLTEIITQLNVLQKTAHKIALIDVITSFAKLAEKNNYTLPVVDNDFDLSIEEGRHPVIEKQLSADQIYVSNNVALDPKSQQMIMITGPNMSGKSALLRQTALIVIMAQIGSFVPAKHSKIGIVDKIFTRVGASDNLSTGESTFMVEMNETASILNNLSERSLILLDEIGRGTSTYDGISIAWAIAEYIHQHKYRPKTLFATHYHELNEMSKSFERIKNYNVSVKETKDSIIFLRKLTPGGSEHSFGIHVAKMAAMPQWVIKRANEVLHSLESNANRKDFSPNTEKLTEENMQLSFFQLDDPILESIREEIIKTDINTLTPVEALMKLNEIKRKLGY